MPTQQAIDNLLDLLAKHRATLNHFLNQQAELGKNYTPPGVTNGIIEAKAEIQRIKEALRNWNLLVEDYPNEEVPKISSHYTPPVIQSVVQKNASHKLERLQASASASNITEFKVLTSSLVFRIIGALALGFFDYSLIDGIIGEINTRHISVSDDSGLIVAIIFLTYFVLRLLWQFYFRMKDCIVIFDNGMKILQDRRTQNIYWDSVLSLRKKLEQTSSQSRVSSILKSYQIDLKNGGSIIVKSHYQFIKQLEKEMFYHISLSLLPTVRSEFIKFGFVKFDTVIITNEGVKFGKNFTPWNKIVSIDTYRHLIVMKKTDSQDLQTVGTVGVPNYFVMIDFVNEMIKSQHRH